MDLIKSPLERGRGVWQSSTKKGGYHFKTASQTLFKNASMFRVKRLDVLVETSKRFWNSWPRIYFSPSRIFVARCMSGGRTSATLYLLICWWLSGLLHGWQMFGEVRFKNPCHTCQCILNILILSDFLWYVVAKSLVIRCHKSAWQAMTMKNGSTCHGNLL